MVKLPWSLKKENKEGQSESLDCIFFSNSMYIRLSDEYLIKNNNDEKHLKAYYIQNVYILLFQLMFS